MPPSQSRSGSEGALSSVAAKTAGSRVVFITSSLDRFDDRTGAPAPSCVLWCLVVESVTRRQRARSRRQQHKYCRTTTTLSSQRVRCERAIRTVPRHLLKGLQVGFPCCLAFPFKNAPRMNRAPSPLSCHYAIPDFGSFPPSSALALVLNPAPPQAQAHAPPPRS
jgi:hypothetical protein